MKPVPELEDIDPADSDGAFRCFEREYAAGEGTPEKAECLLSSLVDPDAFAARVEAFLRRKKRRS